jgi:hypothetical protein
MATYKIGDVIEKTNHSIPNSKQPSKVRPMVVAGTYKSKYSTSESYVLFFCTGRNTYFPNATIGCSSKNDAEHCYVIDKEQGKFDLKTYISLLAPSKYGLEHSVIEVDTTYSSMFTKKFTLSNSEIKGLLECAFMSKNLNKHILNSISVTKQNYP